MEETEVHGENHGPIVSHWQTLSHNVVSSAMIWVCFVYDNHMRSSQDSSVLLQCPTCSKIWMIGA